MKMQDLTNVNKALIIQCLKKHYDMHVSAGSVTIAKVIDADRVTVWRLCKQLIKEGIVIKLPGEKGDYTLSEKALMNEKSKLWGYLELLDSEEYSFLKTQ